MTTRLSELQRIEKAMNTTKSTRMQQRYQVILLHLKGYQNIQIADIVGRCEHTVGKYINTYKKHGIGALIIKPREGAKPKLTPEQEAILIQTVSTKTPDQVGLSPYKSWNSKLVCLWVKEQLDVSYTNGGMRDMLLRLGFSYTKPTYSLAKANSEKQETFKEDFEVLKKLI